MVRKAHIVTLFNTPMINIFVCIFVCILYEPQNKVSYEGPRQNGLTISPSELPSTMYKKEHLADEALSIAQGHDCLTEFGSPNQKINQASQSCTDASSYKTNTLFWRSV